MLAHRRGHLSMDQDYTFVIQVSRDIDSITMPTVDTANLIDARGVADLLGLSHPNSVSTYQRRYSDMPRPVVDLGSGRCKLWLKSDVEHWMRDRGFCTHAPELEPRSDRSHEVSANLSEPSARIQL